MRIARVEAIHCDAGWRPWTFTRVETDTGLVGWGECSDTRNPHGLAARGFTALKTNIVLPGDRATTYFPGFGRGPGTTDGVLKGELLERIEQLVDAFSRGAGPGLQIALDLNYNFRPQGVIDIGERLQ